MIQMLGFVSTVVMLHYMQNLEAIQWVAQLSAITGNFLSHFDDFDHCTNQFLNSDV